MKNLLLGILSLVPILIFAQPKTTGYFRYDTVKIQKVGGSAELVLLNSTRDSIGFLFNVGGGRTEFKRVKQANDSTLIFGVDTFKIKAGVGGTGSTNSSVGGGFKLAINGTNNVKTINQGTTFISIDSIIANTLRINIDTTSLYNDIAAKRPLNVVIDTFGGLRKKSGAEDTLYVQPGAAGTVNLDAAPTVGSTANASTSNGTALALLLKNENNGEINVLQHGMTINDGTDDAAALKAMKVAGFKKLFFPAGRYDFSDSVLYSSVGGYSFRGEVGTEFYSTTKKTFLMFEATLGDIEISNIKFNSRVVDVTNTPSAGLIFFYSQSTGLQAKNIRIHDCIFTNPFTKSNAVFVVSQGTGAMMSDFWFTKNLIDTTGRMGFEFINHQDLTNDRFTDIHCNNNTFKHVGYVTSGPVAVVAISFSGPGNNSEANYNQIIDTHEGASVTNGGIENAQSTNFKSIGNSITSPSGFGSIAFMGSAGMAPAGIQITNWLIADNTIDLHSATHPEYCYGLLAGNMENSTITNNTSSTDNYFIKTDHRFRYNLVDGNTANRTNTGSSNVVYLADTAQNNTFINNKFKAIGAGVQDAIVQTDGAQTKYNTFSDSLRGDNNIEGIVYQVNSSTDNLTVKAVKRYAGNPEGNVTGSIGDLTVNTSTGLMYSKTSGTGTKTGWTAIGAADVQNTLIVSRLEYIHSGTAAATYTDTTLIGAQIMSVSLEGYNLGFTPRSTAYMSFNSATGTITLSNANFYNDDQVIIVYRTSPIFLLDGSGVPVKDINGKYIILN